MRVLIIAANYAEKAWMLSAKQTAEALARFGKVDVTVVTSNVGGFNEYEYLNGVHLHRLDSYFIPDPFNYTITPSIFKWVFEHRDKFDVFIINKYMFYNNLTAIMLRALGKRVIIQTDTFPGVNWFHPTSRLLNAFMWLYARTLGWWVLKSAGKVIVLHSGNIDACRLLDLDRVSVIHSGVDYPKFRDAKPSKDILKIKGKRLAVIWVGRLDEIKGYKRFIELAKGLDIDQYQCIMVCGDKYPELRQKLAFDNPKIEFLGFRSDIPEILKASDIYVMTSYDEGLPNTVMEAMAAGLPVISSNVGGVSDLITHQYGGFLIDNGDLFMAYAEKYIRRLESKIIRKFHGKVNQSMIEGNFDLPIVARKWKVELMVL